MNTSADNTTALQSRPRHVRAASFAAGLIVSCSVLVFTYGSGHEEFAPERIAPNEVAAVQDFSRFRHDTSQHTRLPCLVCHVRKDNSSAPKMPGHIPCSSCHTQEFAAGNQHPICSICHTATDVKRFPPLRSFNAVFDHGRHVRQTSCATCHKPTNRGVALSIPSRLSAHTTCFQCHSPGAMAGGTNIGSCSTCHKPGRLVRTTESARAFAVNFNHTEHARKRLSCSACHTVRAGIRRGAQVTSPVASMHFARAGTSSCAACHNNKRAFGGNDFSDCKKCHERSTFKF
ncbi:MAG: cytochrome c3 family protein [Acidobacteriota bacterium]